MTARCKSGPRIRNFDYWGKWSKCVNPRPAGRGGGGFWTPPPPAVFADIWKTAAPYHLSILYILWKFQTRVLQGQVTRSLQVTSPHKHIIKCFNVCHSYTKWRIALKLSAIDKCNSMYKIRNFHIGDLRSGQFCDLSRYYKSMGENSKPSFSDESHSKHSQTLNYK